MDAREIIRRSIRAFFIVFAMGTIGYTVFAWFYFPVHRSDGILYGDVAMLLFISFVTSQAYWIYYSRADLSHRQFNLRRAAHFLFVQGVAITGIVWITYARQQAWVVSYTFGVIVMFLYVCIIYATITLVESFNYKKLTDEINKRLNERFKE